jgi:riboflavin synthase
MFTGIIEKTGSIKIIEKKEGKIFFTIEIYSVKPDMVGAKQFNRVNFLKDVKIGDSISCDGVCLTVIKRGKNYFTVELMPETLKRTKFKESKIGDKVNLELALKIGDRLGGHFVSGHIDGIGEVKKIIKDSGNYELIIKVSAGFSKFLPFKGSVAINGVSLTISGVGKDWLKASLIKHTLKETNLSELKIGNKVNIEVDMLARYLEKLLKRTVA